MSTLLDHLVADFSSRRGGVLHRAADTTGHDRHADAGHGLRGVAPWRSIPLRVSNDRADAYFEIHATPSPAAGAEQWRWRLCTADGQISASSDAYARHDDCLAAVNALRRSAGAARIRDSEKD